MTQPRRPRHFAGYSNPLLSIAGAAAFLALVWWWVVPAVCEAVRSGRGWQL